MLSYVTVAKVLRKLLGITAFAVFIPGLANAESSLIGRDVSLSILTYDIREKPLFAGEPHSVIVGDGIEFGLNYEGAQNDLDVVPLMIDISKSRIELNYSVAEPGYFFGAIFNGYVLSFNTDCVLFQRAEVDTEHTNMPIDNDRISFDRGILYINVSDISFDRNSKFAVDIEVADCPLS